MLDLTLADTLLRFTGRLHPILVHFPIALLIVAAMLETLRLLRRKPDPSPSAITCVILGALGAAAAAFSGWMNADFEPHSAGIADTIFWHRWLSVTVAVLGVILAIMAIGARFILTKPAVQRVYTLLLLAIAGMVGFTGHLGGTMVYGDGYLFEVFRSPTPSTPGTPDPADIPAIATRPPPAGAVLSIDFARDIQPILTANCIDCHGPTKHKANLRLDAPGHIFADAADDMVVIPSDPEHSEILARLRMKKGDEGRMPPRGDPLPAEQVELIRRWIAEGAYWPAANTTPPTAPPAPVPVATPEPAAPVNPRTKWEGTQIAAIEALRAAGARVEPIAANSEDLDINLSIAGAKATDQLISAVEALAPRVVTLNLARAAITDASAPALAKLIAVRRLHLESTQITDTTLKAIAVLPKLEYLNLTSTKVTDTGILALAATKSLKSLYLAETAATLEGVLKLQEANPTLDIEMGLPKQ